MTYRLISCVIIGMLNCHAHVSEVFVLLLVQHLHIVIIFVSSTKTPKFSLSFWWKVWNFCCHHFENDFIFINTVNYFVFHCGWRKMHTCAADVVLVERTVLTVKDGCDILQSSSATNNNAVWCMAANHAETYIAVSTHHI